jgi:sulfopyruvate decarboxylase TPP-binding subunit
MRHTVSIRRRQMANPAIVEKLALALAEHPAILTDRAAVAYRFAWGIRCARWFRRSLMNDVSTTALSPETVLRQVKDNGVTDIVWLPDSETNWLYLLMKAEPSLRLVGVNREGHACSIAAGLAAGGRKPLILIQNTGMMESGDSIRGWLLGLSVPVVLMVGYRGWTRHGVTTDTAATYTEKFLMAFGLDYYLVESDADASRITTAFEEADRTKRPVVVLVGDEYHGFNR